MAGRDELDEPTAAEALGTVAYAASGHVILTVTVGIAMVASALDTFAHRRHFAWRLRTMWLKPGKINETLVRQVKVNIRQTRNRVVSKRHCCSRNPVASHGLGGVRQPQVGQARAGRSERHRGGVRQKSTSPQFAKRGSCNNLFPDPETISNTCPNHHTCPPNLIVTRIACPSHTRAHHETKPPIAPNTQPSCHLLNPPRADLGPYLCHGPRPIGPWKGLLLRLELQQL